MSKKPKNRWLKEPEEHDYPAAESYLTLLYDDQSVPTSKQTRRSWSQGKSFHLFFLSETPAREELSSPTAIIESVPLIRLMKMPSFRAKSYSAFIAPPDCPIRESARNSPPHR